MTYEEYAAIKAVNWSTLKHMATSPLHYLTATTGTFEETDAMTFGRAVHCLVFEPDVFGDNFAIYDGGRRSGTVWADFIESTANGRSVLKRDQYDAAQEVAKRVRDHPLARPLLDDALFEVTTTWTDPDTGLACKGRIDTVRNAIADLKVTADIREFRMSQMMARMGYHAQLAFYQDGWSAHTYQSAPALLIAAESKPPHDVAVYEIDDDALHAGRCHYQDLLKRLKHCRDTGQWPGIYTERQTLRLPRWMLDDEEDATGLDIDVET